MKCWECKKQIDEAIRLYRPAKNYRERSQFRDVCEDCYKEIKSIRIKNDRRTEDVYKK